jgi:thiol-disulfide isomerase/thioredoxin
MTRWSWVVAAAVLGATAAGAQELAAVDRPAPNFRLPVYNPQPVGSASLGLDSLVGPDATDKQTRAVLVSFMASFCAPCKKEMPYLQSLHERYKDLGLRVMMVSIDTEPEGQKIIDGLIAEHKVTFPVLKDRFNLVARRWLGAQSPLPSVFMVRPDATVSMVHRGYDQEASALFEREVEAALGIKRVPAPAPAPLVAPASASGTSASPVAKPAAATGKPARPVPAARPKAH